MGGIAFNMSFNFEIGPGGICVPGMPVTFTASVTDLSFSVLLLFRHSKNMPSKKSRAWTDLRGSDLDGEVRHPIACGVVMRGKFLLSESSTSRSK